MAGRTAHKIEVLADKVTGVSTSDEHKLYSGVRSDGCAVDGSELHALPVDTSPSKSAW